MGLLGGASKLLGGGSSSKTTTKPATVWGTQAPYLQDLYSQAQGIYRGMSGYRPQEFDQAGYDQAYAAWAAANPTLAKQAQAGAGSSLDPNLWSRQSGGIIPTWVNNKTGAVVGYNPYTAKGGNASGQPHPGMPTKEQFMRQGAEDPLAANFRNITGLAQNTWTGLMNGSDPYSQGLAQNAMQSLLSASGSPYASGVGKTAMDQLLAGPQNPYLTGMANAAMNTIGQNFQSQIMPALLGGGNAAGQLGGSRYAMLQNQAASDAMRTMGDVGNQIYGNAWNTGIQSQAQALGMLGDVYGQNLQAQQGALGMVGDVWAQNLQARQNALGMTGDIAGMPFLPLQQYANILGRPTVLAGGGSSSSDSSNGLLSGISMGFSKAL